MADEWEKVRLINSTCEHGGQMRKCSACLEIALFKDVERLKARNELLETVYETAKDVYEWANPTSELQQAEMLFLHDAIVATDALNEDIQK